MVIDSEKVLERLRRQRDVVRASMQRQVAEHKAAMAELHGREAEIALVIDVIEGEAERVKRDEAAKAEMMKPKPLAHEQVCRIDAPTKDLSRRYGGTVS